MRRYRGLRLVFALVRTLRSVWTPPWVVLVRRFLDLKLLGVSFLMDAGSGVMGCASLYVLMTLGIALNTLLGGTGTW